MNSTVDMIAYDHGIYALDSGLVRRRLTAIHVVVERGHAAIVDTGGSRSAPRVLDALEQLGVPPHNVDYVMLTHVHLDHAGGAGALMQQFPNAELTVHPRGARHVVDPSRLVEGTIAVYGEDYMDRVYGPVVPVPAHRVIETPHESRIDLQGRELVFFDTPGHARHHVSIWDARARAIFAGDTFGLAYTELDDPHQRYIFPTTSPTQFDPAAAHRSLDLITGLAPIAAYVAHFGEVRDVPARADDLRRLIDAHAELGRAGKDTGDARRERLRAGVKRLALAEAQRRGWEHRSDEVYELMADDIELNALGLACWLDAMP
ncbi:MAG TPA: MBL fold metallo-hydrolase [Burkholderiales bacterium]|nr:MBL fold metallo-hydrolase [Burkholderiales bacterium]